MEKTVGELYTEKVKAQAEEFAKAQLENIKGFMPQSEYLETATELMNVFIAGANCARNVLQELVELKKKEQQ